MIKNEYKNHEFNYTKRMNKERIKTLYFSRYGEEYLNYRRAWKNAGRNGFLPEYPVHLDIEVTDSCNLRCNNCPRNKNVFTDIDSCINTGSVFSFKNFKKIINETEGFSKSINFGMSGEFTLQFDLFLKMVKYADVHGFIDKTANTNGVLLDEKKIDKILNSGLDYLSISVDSNSSDTYKSLKNVDNFEHVFDMVKLFYEKKQERGHTFPLLRTSFYVCENNIDEAKGFYERFNRYSDFTDLQGFTDYYNVYPLSDDKYCDYPFKRLTFRADGTVYPCCSFHGFLLPYKIYNGSVKKIWHSDTFNKLRMLLMNKDFPDVCKSCLSSVRDELLKKVVL